MENSEIKNIQLLPDFVINQIAAGEVVERPASVIKELVENSIDANATKIEISIKDGGTKYISIVDNGDGIPQDKMALALKRHATSKMSSIDDLLSIGSFGFRGEALPSIAAVSEFTFISKPENQDLAYFIKLKGGKQKEDGLKSLAKGTKIIVENLFHNVPARLKFLKSKSTETAHIQNVLIKLALSYPHIHFVLINDERISFEYPPHRDRLNRAQTILKRRAKGDLHSFESNCSHGISVEVMLASPENTLRDTSGLHFFVNNRPVRNRMLLKAVTGGFGGLLEKGRYPVSVLYLEISQNMVDINVHPQKSEVRFQNDRLVAGCVRGIIQSALMASPWALGGARGAIETGKRKYVLNDNSDENSQVSSEKTELYGNQKTRIKNIIDSTKKKFQLPLSSVNLTEKPDSRSSKPAKSQISKSKPSQNILDKKPIYKVENGNLEYVDNEKKSSNLNARFMGLFGGVYLFYSTEKGVLVVDMHAAHERVRYDKILRELKDKGVKSQRLLFPATITMSREKIIFVKENLSLFNSLGLEVEEFSENSIIVRTIPFVLKDPNIEDLMFDLISHIKFGGTGEDYAGKMDEIAARLACHSAIRKGDAITSNEAILLLNQIQKVESGGHCPHGRPVSFIMSLNEIEKKFKRK
jgi:DNA mismatch repair protein MutL